MLAVIKQRIHPLLRAICHQPVNRSGKIITLVVDQRNTAIRQRLLNLQQVGMDKRRLTRCHLMLPPLPRSSDKHRQHAGSGIATGGVQRFVIGYTQIVT
ncbi:hypothetical protein D3C80_1317710 [compost metagenome]